MNAPALPINEAPGARAYRQIKGWIEDGRLTPGDNLLPEQALAEQLGVARTTIRSTLSRLEADGWVRLTGRKRTVLPRPGRQPGAIAKAVVFLGAQPQVSGNRVRLPGWSDAIAFGAAEAVQRQGGFVINLPPDPGSDRLAQLLSERPRGVLICDEFQDLGSSLATIVAAGIPCVGYGHHQTTGMTDFHTVTSNHAAGGRAMCEALLRRGCRRPLRCWQGFPGRPRPIWLAERDRGYLEAMREAGLAAPEPVLIPPGDGQVSADAFRREAHTVAGYLAPHVFGTEPPDGLLAPSDGIVPYLAAALRILGRDPASFPIVGYDHYWNDIRELRWEATPPIATVDKQNARMGAEMVRLLDGLIDGSLQDPPREHAFAPLVIEPVAG